MRGSIPDTEEYTSYSRKACSKLPVYQGNLGSPLLQLLNSRNDPVEMKLVQGVDIVHSHQDLSSSAGSLDMYVFPKNDIVSHSLIEHKVG